jgi:hypothetical protein
MSRRKRPKSRARGAALARPRRVTRDPRPAMRTLREVRKNQMETGEELRGTTVPVGTEPAFIFTP